MAPSELSSYNLSFTEVMEMDITLFLRIQEKIVKRRNEEIAAYKRARRG